MVVAGCVESRSGERSGRDAVVGFGVGVLGDYGDSSCFRGVLEVRSSYRVGRVVVR